VVIIAKIEEKRKRGRSHTEALRHGGREGGKGEERKRGRSHTKALRHGGREGGKGGREEDLTRRH